MIPARFLAVYPFCFISSILLIYLGIALVVHGYLLNIACVVNGILSLLVFARRVAFNAGIFKKYSFVAGAVVFLIFLVSSIASMVLSIVSFTVHKNHGLEHSISELAIIFSFLNYGFYLVHWFLNRNYPASHVYSETGSQKEKTKRTTGGTSAYSTTNYPVNYYTGNTYQWTCGNEYGNCGPVHHHHGGHGGCSGGDSGGYYGGNSGGCNGGYSGGDSGGYSGVDSGGYSGGGGDSGGGGGDSGGGGGC